jgi:hypothetical protein
MTIQLSHFSRLEPRPRENDFTRALAAEVRDPLWFLARQWQMGEFNGDDAGSLTYVQYSGRTTNIPRWIPPGQTTEQALDLEAPLEKQTLREPFEPDLGLSVELGHDFADLLRAEAGGDADDLLAAFRAIPRFQIVPLPEGPVVNPLDAATKRFLTVCAGRTLNGYELYKLALEIAEDVGEVPDSVTMDPTLIQAIEDALASLVERTRAIFGDVGGSDPVTWDPRRLEYGLRVVAEDPVGQGNVTLQAYPDSNGEYDWFSFDIVGKNTAAVEAAPTPVAKSIIPARVRFPGMPVMRFWAFEENDLALPDILASETDDILKLLITDFMTIHANDWFVIPFDQKVGTLAQIDWILVHDSFGKQSIVRRADRGETAAGTNRWTMFSSTDISGGSDGLGDWFMVPPSPGAGMVLGSVLEDVRFGRDEMANMAFAIERVTQTPIGEPLTGSERDAAVNQRRGPISTETTGSGMPLRYDIESEIPANWIPLLPRIANPSPSPPDPSIVLQRGQAVKSTGGGPAAVPALSKIMNPDLNGAPYLIEEEEVARDGLRIDRVVYRSRWTNGSTHLWVERRRKIGAGESQSGLAFDQARQNDE